MIVEYVLVQKKIFSGFDAPQVFYSDNFGAQGGEGSETNLVAFKKRFKEFLREFRTGGAGAGETGSFSYKYRDTLKRHVALNEFHLTVNLEDLASFDEEIADKVYKVLCNLSLSTHVLLQL